VRGIGVRERVQGKAFAGRGQKCGHPWQWGHVDVIPTGGHLLVGETKAEGPAQRGEVARSVDLSSFVLLVCVIEREPSFELGGITVGAISPESECSREVDRDHHSPEIEEQGADPTGILRRFAAHPAILASRWLRVRSKAGGIPSSVVEDRQ
jgi:hypothetical protein